MAKVFMNRFESEMMTSGKTDESLDSMLRRFKKKTIEEGILEEVRRRQFFLNKATKRLEKSKRARIRAIKEAKKRK